MSLTAYAPCHMYIRTYVRTYIHVCSIFVSVFVVENKSFCVSVQAVCFKVL